MEKLDFRTLNKFNPLKQSEIFIDNHSGSLKSKIIELNFKGIIDDNNILRILCIAKDITKEFYMKKEIEETRKKANTEMELFYKIIHVDPSVFNDFMNDFKKDLKTISSILEKEDNNLKAKIKEIFRIIHSIKGDSQILELDFFTDIAHKFEDKLKELKDKKDLKNEDFISLAIMYSHLEEIVLKTENLLEKINMFQKKFVSTNFNETDFIHVSLEKLVLRLGKDNGKLVKFIHNDFDYSILNPETKKV